MKRLLLLAVFICNTCVLFANIRLAGIFGDNMVLQRNQTISIWGWGDSDEKLTLQFNSLTLHTTAEKDGAWVVKIPAQKEGGPYMMKISGLANTIQLNNILVGEVWVCSGQSNMEFHVRDVHNAAFEISSAHYPMIRQIEILKTVAGTPQSDIKGNPVWKSATPEQVADFTGVGYFFALELYRNLKVPVGLIHTSWGGTHSETWTSRIAFENDTEFSEMIRKLPALNLDSLLAIQQKLVAEKLNSLQGGLPDAKRITAFRQPDIDDHQWPTLQVPGLWETQKLENFDGEVWLRKSFDLSATEDGRSATLHLGMIDDNDEAFINGVSVGHTKGYNLERRYTIPAGLLKSGKNSVAVKVEDTGGGGGFYGEPKNVYIETGSRNISLAGIWNFQVSALRNSHGGVGPNDYPDLLFNGMLSPLIPYAIRGAIWYQGESNAGRAYQYRKAFPLMINDWRKHWQQGDFPFYFVQLSSFNANKGNSKVGSAWAELREAQSFTLSLPNTGMAVTTDIGAADDIHPRNKQDVGKRLAAIALHKTYKKEMVYSGPEYDHMTIQGDKVLVYFKPSGSPLKVNAENGKIMGIEIAGENKQFIAATAGIEGDHVVVQAKGIKKPVAVRYGWMDDAGSINLFNKAGFPASPFRTDQWPGITENNKFRVN